MAFVIRILALIVWLCSIASLSAYAQHDSVIVIKDSVPVNKPAQSKTTNFAAGAEKQPSVLIVKGDTTTKIKNPNARIPRKAAIRSAILPGWGQVYNGKWWKVPIVYAAVGGTGWYFLYSLKNYKDTRAGYKLGYQLQSSTLSSIDKLQLIKNANLPDNIMFAVNRGDINTLQYYRDQYRRDVDYSAVYFVAAWLLNVVDATVDAHLSNFDVSPNLSMGVKPGYSELARTNGLSLVLRFK